jgi:hypothetical protein
MLRLADLVTTDTAGHRDLLASEHGVADAAIVPDSIDYTVPAPPAGAEPPPASPLRILWFGSFGNIGMLGRYVDLIASLPEARLVVATSADRLEDCIRRYPQVAFEPWTRAGFVRTLRGCHLSCLMHDGSTIDRAKSNNKQITSIAWGVPAVVSRTPEYERTALELGVPESTFADEAGLARAIEGLRSPSARAAYLQRAQPPAWERYSPEAVARRFVEIVAARRAAPARVPPGFWRRLADRVGL